MKKLILSFMVAIFSIDQVGAKNVLIEKIKEIPANSIAAACYVVSCVYDSNEVKIKKALDAKKEVDSLVLNLSIVDNVEESLLKNIQALGLTKKNALFALKTIENDCNNMQSVVNRNKYLSYVNKSDLLEQASQEVFSSLHKCKIYKAYFQSHKDCLKAWELTQRYENVFLVDIANINSVFSVMFGCFGCCYDYPLIKWVNKLSDDVKFIKDFLFKKEFKQKYSVAYEELSKYFIILDSIKSKIKESNEYKSQLSHYYNNINHHINSCHGDLKFIEKK